MKNLLPALFLSLAASLCQAASMPSAAPLFAATLNNPDGKPVALAQYRGKPLIVNFWARWCPPCRAEIPDLVAFREAQRGKIEVLGIGIEDEAAPVRQFVRDHRMSYPVFVAGAQGMTLMQALANTRSGLPYSVFIDRQGRIVGTRLGKLGPADLQAAAALLLKN